MTVSTAASVHEIAQDLLDAAETILATTVGGPVALVYLSPGMPSLDFQCDQIAVWNANLGEEATSPLSPVPAPGFRRRNGWLNLVTLSTLVARCIRVGKTTSTGYTPPGAAVLSADAAKVMEDGWALYNGISTAIIQDGLFGGTCQDIKFVSMTPLTPQGGMGGWVLTLSIELAGYR